MPDIQGSVKILSLASFFLIFDPNSYDKSKKPAHLSRRPFFIFIFIKTVHETVGADKKSLDFSSLYIAKHFFVCMINIHLTLLCKNCPTQLSSFTHTIK